MKLALQMLCDLWTLPDTDFKTKSFIKDRKTLCNDKRTLVRRHLKLRELKK